MTDSYGGWADMTLGEQAALMRETEDAGGEGEGLEQLSRWAGAGRLSEKYFYFCMRDALPEERIAACLVRQEELRSAGREESPASGGVTISLGRLAALLALEAQAEAGKAPDTPADNANGEDGGTVPETPDGNGGGDTAEIVPVANVPAAVIVPAAAAAAEAVAAGGAPGPAWKNPFCKALRKMASVAR
ncbi:hypothetical protein HKX48_003210 [Thoreauomyces humboldtii]|nr:hypothetical protein HKX48_003210 [Thoreauomyces humboldtii]